MAYFIVGEGRRALVVEGESLQEVQARQGASWPGVASALREVGSSVPRHAPAVRPATAEEACFIRTGIGRRNSPERF